MERKNFSILLNRGPQVLVTFHVKKGMVIKTSLMLRKEKGLAWQVVADKEVSSQLLEVMRQWVEDYAFGGGSAIALPLEMGFLSDYTRLVFKELQKVPFGAATTYAKLASVSGRPKAFRAVGNICARNPFPLVIPCHRVLAKDSHLGGFSAGLEVKKCLLGFEKISYK